MATSSAANQRKVRSTGHIVHLKCDRTPDVLSATYALSDKHATVKPHTMLHETVRGFAMAHAPNHVLQKLRMDPRVDSIEPDIEVQGYAQTVPWSVGRVGATGASSTAANGAVDAHIFVLDTGVQSKHPDLNVVESVSFVRSERNTDDLNGHGTMVAGCAAARDNRSHVVGVAPGAKIHSYKVLDRSGSGSLSVIISAIDRVIQFKRSFPDKRVIINLSLGGYTGNAAYTALDVAIRTAVCDYGITVVVAAGNEAMDAALCTPAHTAEAITVGAYNSANAIAPFSNTGSAVDILAPGADVLTTGTNSSVKTASGTSFSCPYVAGAAALYLAHNPAATPAQVGEALKALAVSAGVSANPLITGIPRDTTPYGLYVGALLTKPID